MPWPREGDDLYFEVAVVADSGVRYEFHHVDRASLPVGIATLLNAGGGRVEAGTLLGHAITWPDGDYHHIHYNLVLPSGTRINPEFVSPLLADHRAPEIADAGTACTVARTGRHGALPPAGVPARRIRRSRWPGRR